MGLDADLLLFSELQITPGWLAFANWLPVHPTQLARIFEPILCAAYALLRLDRRAEFILDVLRN